MTCTCCFHADLHSLNLDLPMMSVDQSSHSSRIFYSYTNTFVIMKIAVLATLVASASAFGINKADLGKVRVDIGHGRVRVLKRRACVARVEHGLRSTGALMTADHDLMKN